jgi:acyl dehydratase
MSMKLFVTGELQLAGGSIGLGVDSLEWPRPVRPGDTLRLETEILEVRPSRSKPDRGIIRIRNVTTNQEGEVV